MSFLQRGCCPAVLSLIAATTVLVTSASATTIYVSPAGDTSVTGQDPNKPTTVKHLAQDVWLQDGWEIVFKSGTYDLSDADRGASFIPVRAKNLVFRSETGDPADVVLDGKGASRAFYNHSYGWGEGTGSGAFIAGLTITNCTGVKVGNQTDQGSAVRICYGGVVSNCVIRMNAGSSVVALGAYKDGPCELVDCVLDNAESSVSSSLLTADAGWGSVTVRRCTFLQNGLNRGVSASGGSKDASLARTTRLVDCSFENCYGYWGANAGHIGFVSNCTFTANHALGCGGALYIEAPSALIYDSAFTNNWLAGGDGKTTCGGAVCGPLAGTGVGSYDGVTWTNAVLSGCTFVGNRLPDGFGGAVYGRFAHVRNCVFERNQSSASGGALYFQSAIQDGRADMVGCRFAANTNALAGGSRENGGSAVYSGVKNLMLTEMVFTNNFAAGSGAVLCSLTDDTSKSITSTELALTNCTFTGNVAQYHGGAIRGACKIVRGCVFSDNESLGTHNDGNYTSRGGAIEVLSRPNETNSFENCTFSGNICRGKSAGAVSGYSGALAFERCSFVSNALARAEKSTFVTEVGGGAIGFAQGPGGTAAALGRGLLVDACLFAGNSASSSAGGAVRLQNMMLQDSHPIIRNSLFVGNTCAGNGQYGGAVVVGSNSLVTACTFVRNASKNGVGGAIDNGGMSNWKEWGTVRNCLFWMNTGTASDARNVAAYSQTVNAFSYCAEDGTAGKIPTGSSYHNLYLGENAGFVDEAAGDYRLVKGSALVDKGFNEPWMDEAKDLTGKKSARVYNGTVDIGCYEYQPVPGLLLLLR